MARPSWRAVAIPTEHGGWGLTAEPVVLGLAVAPSRAGAAIGLAAILAFLVRTPLKIVLVDRWRHRWLPRSRVAAAVAASEAMLIVALGLAALLTAGWAWLAPVALAVPFVGVELWFDMHSRSRRLAPELCGAVGIAGAAAGIALAGGAPSTLAAALWLVLAARAVAAVPFVRTQIQRLHTTAVSIRPRDTAQVIGLGVAIIAAMVDPAVSLGAVAVVLLAAAQLRWTRRPPPPARVLGITQLLLGLAIVGATAIGVHVA